MPRFAPCDRVSRTRTGWRAVELVLVFVSPARVPRPAPCRSTRSLPARLRSSTRRSIGDGSAEPGPCVASSRASRSGSGGSSRHRPHRGRARPVGAARASTPLTSSGGPAHRRLPGASAYQAPSTGPTSFIGIGRCSAADTRSSCASTAAFSFPLHVVFPNLVAIAPTGARARVDVPADGIAGRRHRGARAVRRARVHARAGALLHVTHARRWTELTAGSVFTRMPVTIIDWSGARRAAPTLALDLAITERPG